MIASHILTLLDWAGSNLLRVSWNLVLDGPWSLNDMLGCRFKSRSNRRTVLCNERGDLYKLVASFLYIGHKKMSSIYKKAVLFHSKGLAVSPLSTEKTFFFLSSFCRSYSFLDYTCILLASFFSWIWCRNVLYRRTRILLECYRVVQIDFDRNQVVLLP